MSNLLLRVMEYWVPDSYFAAPPAADQRNRGGRPKKIRCRAYEMSSAKDKEATVLIEASA